MKDLEEFILEEVKENFKEEKRKIKINTNEIKRILEENKWAREVVRRIIDYHKHRNFASFKTNCDVESAIPYKIAMKLYIAGLVSKPIIDKFSTGGRFSVGFQWYFDDEIFNYMGELPVISNTKKYKEIIDL